MKLCRYFSLFPDLPLPRLVVLVVFDLTALPDFLSSFKCFNVFLPLRIFFGAK